MMELYKGKFQICGVWWYGSNQMVFLYHKVWQTTMDTTNSTILLCLQILFCCILICKTNLRFYSFHKWQNAEQCWNCLSQIHYFTGVQLPEIVIYVPCMYVNIFFTPFPFFYFYCRWKRKLIKKQFTSIIRVYQRKKSITTMHDDSDDALEVVSFYNTSTNMLTEIISNCFHCLF